MNWNNLAFRIGMNLTKLTMVSIIVGTTFCLCALAQTKSDAPLDAEGVALLVEQLKNSLAKEVEDEELQTSIVEKWDVQLAKLLGKTSRLAVDLLLTDVRSSVKDAKVVDRLTESFNAIVNRLGVGEDSTSDSNKTAVVKWDGCPPLPSALARILRWEVIQVPSQLLCRALLTDSGSEAFAMSISRESLFSPRRSDRAESARLNGREVFWYRSKSAEEPNVQMREMLIQIDQDRVVHLWVRANNADTLIKFQQYALSLPFPDHEK